MESLASIQHYGGVRFYCFSEAKLKLFSSMPEGTLKSWVRFLEIQRVKPSTGEHGFLHRTIPGYALAAFHLISEHDLVRLVGHSDRRRVMSSTGETQSFPPKGRIIIFLLRLQRGRKEFVLTMIKGTAHDTSV